MKNYLKRKFVLTDKGASELLKATGITVFINLAIMIMSAISYYFIKDTLVPILDGLPLTYSILFYLSYALILIIVLTIAYYFQYNFCYISAYEESATLRITLAETLRKLPLSFFGKKDLSDVTTTLMSDVSTMENAFSHFIPSFFGSIISTIIMTCSMYIFDWRLALSLTWVIPLSFILIVLSKKIQDFYVVKTKKIQLEYVDKIQECLENIKDIKANSREEAHLNIMSEHFDKYEKSSIQSELITGSFVNFSQVVLKLGIGTTTVVGVALLANNEISILTLLVFLMLASRIYDPLAGALINLAGIFITLKSVERMNDYNNTVIQSGSDIELSNGYDIHFDNVEFGYEESDMILNKVSFTAKQNEVTALVGPSGSGKSTAMKLAARFWDVKKGSITIGDININQVEPESLLKNISIVFQDVTLFNNTIMENIRIGKKNATDEEVIIASKDAMCHDFILSLPNGYDTLIGENGSKLSGGERQRISIARALLKDAPIVFLDEATSSLDIQNESAVQKAIARLTRDKTVIVIAHRMRTIAGANKIVLLKEGVVCDEGTHNELLEKSKDYKTMINLQSENLNWKII